ncbi:MAG: hypothetical protein JNN30_07445 [Rhodanobacteraceae bacterium]|nr:hypothetical protein [Rhodanobacteraceae bacterium]
MRRLLLCLALALTASLTAAVPAAAEQSDNPFDVTEWKAACRISDSTIHFRFTSPSGDASNDDMVATADFGHSKPEPVALEPALYVPSHTLFTVDNACDEVVGVPLAQGRLLIFLQRSDRPSHDRLSLILADTIGKKLLDVRNNVGSLKFSTLVLRKNGSSSVDVRIVREVLDDPVCDCNELFIEDWLRIRVAADRIRADWLRK